MSEDEEEEYDNEEEDDGEDEGDIESSGLMSDIKNNSEKILKNAEHEDWSYRQIMDELRKLKMKMPTNEIANINERTNSYIAGVKETLYSLVKRKRNNMDEKIKSYEKLNLAYPNRVYREQIEVFGGTKKDDDDLVLICLKLLSVYARRDELLVNKVIDLSIDGSKKMSMEAIEKIRWFEKELEAMESFIGYKFQTDGVRIERQIALKNPKYGSNVGYNRIGGVRSVKKDEEE
jgi:hypothetical protein